MKADLEEQHAPPALWGHTLRVYEAMAAEAESVQEDGKPASLVYEGYITHLFRDCNVPVPMYGDVLRVLKRMECIVQLKRGGGGAKSRWAITGVAELDSFMEANGQLIAKTSTSRGKTTQLEQQVDDIRKSIGGLDVVKALSEMQHQLNEMQSDLSHHRTVEHKEEVI